MKSNFKNLLFCMLIILAPSCKRAAGRWTDGLSGYREAHSGDLSIEILRIGSDGDTAKVNYRVRIRPDAKYSAVSAQHYNFYYRMDSCFFLRSGGKNIQSVFVETVPDGIKGCFEYLVSFDIGEAAKLKPIDLVYQDRYIDQKPYILSLNKQ